MTVSAFSLTLEKSWTENNKRVETESSFVSLSIRVLAKNRTNWKKIELLEKLFLTNRKTTI